MDKSRVVRAEGLRAPKAAAIAGIVFSLLLTTALVLVTVSVPSDPAEAGAWITDSTRRDAVIFALSLVPFAGMAFLWFVGVVRDRIGEHEDRLFATVFLGSGLLFIAMLFVTAAVAGGLLADPAISAGRAPAAGPWGQWRTVTFTLLNVYAMRMGALFILSTTTIALRSATIPKWIALTGYVVALVLLVGVNVSGWANILLPAWVLILSVHILLVSPRASTSAAGTGDTTEGIVT